MEMADKRHRSNEFRDLREVLSFLYKIFCLFVIVEKVKNTNTLWGNISLNNWSYKRKQIPSSDRT